MTQMTTRIDHDDNACDIVAPRDGIGRLSIENKNTEVSISKKFFYEQRDIVTEIFSFLDPPSILKMCHGMRLVSSFLTHKHVVRSVTNTLRGDTFDQENQCYRRNRHRYRHIQYHKIVVEKLIPSFKQKTSIRQSPMQLLRSVSGRRCKRCQLDLIPVTGW